MKLYITILSTILFLITLSYPAYCGTTLQTISKTMQIVDMDEYMRKEREKAEQRLKEIKGAYVFASSTTIKGE